MTDIAKDDLCSKGIHCWKPTVVLGEFQYLRQCQICGEISYRDRLKETHERIEFMRSMHSGRYRQYADGTVRFGDNLEYEIKPWQFDVKADEDVDNV